MNNKSLTFKCTLFLALLSSACISHSQAQATCTLLPSANYQTAFCQKQYQKVLQLTSNVFNTQNQNVLPGQSLGGVIGIYRRINEQEQICYISCGLKRLNGSPPDEHTMFELASITKTFTGAILGKLVYKKIIDPTSPIGPFIPKGFNLQSNESAVTFQQLATFSGGFCFSNAPHVKLNSHKPRLNQANFQLDVNQIDPTLNSCINDIKIKNIKGVYEQAHLPTYNYYSNSSIGFLAQLLMNYDGFPDALEGSFNGWMCSNLTNILGMNSTNSCMPFQAKQGLCPAKPALNGAHCPQRLWQQANYATGYHLNANHYQQGKPFPFTPWAGAGALRSNASDMIKFIRANLGISTNPQQLALVKGMQIAHRPNNYLPVPTGQTIIANKGSQPPLHGMQGYAWVCQFINGDRICGKIGGHTNFRSFIGFSQQKQYGIIVLFNTGALNQKRPTGIPSPSQIGVDLIKSD